MTAAHEGADETAEALARDTPADGLLGRRRKTTDSRSGVVVADRLHHRAEDDGQKTEEDAGIEGRQTPLSCVETFSIMDAVRSQ